MVISHFFYLFIYLFTLCVCVCESTPELMFPFLELYVWLRPLVPSGADDQYFGASRAASVVVLTVLFYKNEYSGNRF